MVQSENGPQLNYNQVPIFQGARLNIDDLDDDMAKVENNDHASIDNQEETQNQNLNVQTIENSIGQPHLRKSNKIKKPVIS